MKKIESSFSSVFVLFLSIPLYCHLLSKRQNCIWNRMLFIPQLSIGIVVGFGRPRVTNPIYIQWIMRWGQKPHEYEIQDPNTLTELLLSKKRNPLLTSGVTLPANCLNRQSLNEHSFHPHSLAQNEMTQTHILPEYMLFCALSNNVHSILVGSHSVTTFVPLLNSRVLRVSWWWFNS